MMPEIAGALPLSVDTEELTDDIPSGYSSTANDLLNEHDEELGQLRERYPGLSEFNTQVVHADDSERSRFASYSAPIEGDNAFGMQEVVTVCIADDRGTSFVVAGYQTRGIGEETREYMVLTKEEIVEFESAELIQQHLSSPTP